MHLHQICIMTQFKNTFNLILDDLVHEPGHLNWTLRFLQILKDHKIQVVNWIPRDYLSGDAVTISNYLLNLVLYLHNVMWFCVRSYNVQDEVIFIATFHNIQIPFIKIFASKRNYYLCQITNNLDGKRFSSNFYKTPKHIHFCALEQYICDEMANKFDCNCYFIPHPKRYDLNLNRELKNTLLIFGSKLLSDDFEIIRGKYPSYERYLHVTKFVYEQDCTQSKLQTLSYLSDAEYDYYISHVGCIFINRIYDFRISGIVFEALSAGGTVLMRDCKLFRHYEKMGYRVSLFGKDSAGEKTKKNMKFPVHQEVYSDHSIVLGLYNAISSIFSKDN